MDEAELQRIERATEARFLEDLICCGSREHIIALISEIRRQRQEIEGLRCRPHVIRGDHPLCRNEEYIGVCEADAVAMSVSTDEGKSILTDSRCNSRHINEFDFVIGPFKPRNGVQ